MKKNLKKLFALLLVVVMVVAMFAGCANNAETPAENPTPSDATEPTTPTEDNAQTEEPAATETRENKVVYGSSTEISGDLGNAWWTNNATDKIQRPVVRPGGGLLHPLRLKRNADLHGPDAPGEKAVVVAFSHPDPVAACVKVYHDKDETPVTRMATAALIRDELYKGREYLARKARAEVDAEQEGPDYDGKMEALLPLLRGGIEAHFHAHRADDIFTALRISKEFGLRPVIIHGTEAHLVADLIAEEHVPVVCGPYMTDRSKPEIRNLTDEAPGILAKAGIPTAITVDHPEIPLRLLPVAVMLAVRAGMDKTDALRAVTAVPAKIAGLGDRIGSLKAGLDADCVLWSGDPLDIATQVKAVFVNGTPEYRRTR